jgi:hypothetical protein
VTLQRQFQGKFNTQQAPARSAISHLVQKFESTGSVCDKKKGVVGRHRSAHMWDSVDRVHEALLWSLRKSDTMFPVTWYQKNINTHHHVTGLDVVSLQNPSGTDTHCSQQAAEM